MGNMTAIIVVCSICGVLIIALLIAFKVMGSRGSKHNLDDQIEKYRKIGAGEISEYSETVKIDKKQLKNQKNQQKASIKTEKLQKKLNQKVEIEELDESLEETQETESNVQGLIESHSSSYLDESKTTSQKIMQKKQNQRDRDKEFDDFMNQHSYSRVVSNKNLIKQMNKLPNKVKALLLGNVFNKFDE